MSSNTHTITHPRVYFKGKLLDWMPGSRNQQIGNQEWTTTTTIQVGRDWLIRLNVWEGRAFVWKMQSGGKGEQVWMGRSSDWGDRFLFFRRDDIENSFMKIVGHYSMNDVQKYHQWRVFFLHISYHISVCFVPAAIELSNNIKLTIEMHWNMA